MTKRMKKAPDGNQLSHCTHLTKWQQKKFSKIIDEFKLDERDAGLPLEKKFTTAEIEAVVLKCNGLTHDILALLDTTQSQWAAYLKRRPDIAEI